MKFRKMAVLVLALALAAGLAVPTFAATTKPPASNAIEVGAEGMSVAQTQTVTLVMNIPKIQVIVPKTADLVINPYGLEYKDKNGTEATEDDITADSQVIYIPQYIKNMSNVNMAVSVTATGVPSDGVTLTSASAAEATKKSAFMFLEIAVNESTTDDFDTLLPTAVEDYVAGANEDGTGGMIALSTKGGTLKNVVILEGGELSTDEKTVIEGEKAAYAYYTIKGDTSSTAGGSWKTTDTVTVTLAWTFEPTTESYSGEEA